jgi:hypothetical protein
LIGEIVTKDTLTTASKIITKPYIGTVGDVLGVKNIE